MSEKSALHLIPGKDALVEYVAQSYKAKSYVDYHGLIYKSKIDTSSTFIITEWELIGDLREVRVGKIVDRNALTGSTPTSGTTGINIPILDNTNVLVLNAQADPLVGSNKFARYNYNKGTNSFLLLQVSTGSTGSNVSDYNLLSNRPSIISGITATAGAGLTGGGVFSGSVPPNRATFSFAHADTSSQANINSTGYTYIQKMKFDTYGHVTGSSVSTWVHPDTSSQANVNNSGFTYIQGLQVDGAGHLLAIASSTWVHPDTSSQGNVTNTGTTVIQSVTLDGAGHVTGINSATIPAGAGAYSFNTAGDSGGVVAVPNTGTLRVTGGTNIQTVSTLHGSNAGIRINVVPAGSNTQVQFNASGVLSAGSLSYTGGSTTVTPVLAITTTPSAGGSDDVVTWNATTKKLTKVTQTSLRTLPAGITQSIQFNNATFFSGTSYLLYDAPNRAFTSGIRQGTTGVYSTMFGNSNKATGQGAFAAGGQVNRATGQGAFVEGENNGASGNTSHAQNEQTIALGRASHSGGIASTTGKEILAGGIAAFNHSGADASQTVGHGALADYSAILGGFNHNIASGNLRAAIIGGSTIKLTGTTYIDTVAVPTLAIFTTPTTGGTQDLLSWNPATKKVTKVTQASIKVAAGSNTQVQFNNSGAFGASSSFVYDSGNVALSIGTRSGSTGANSFVYGVLNTATGIGSIAMGQHNYAQGGYSVAIGLSSTAIGNNAVAIGLLNTAHDYGFATGTQTSATGVASFTQGYNTATYNDYAHAEGYQSSVSGMGGHAEGFQCSSGGQYSHAEGRNSIANGSYSHSEGDRTVATGDYSHVEGSQTVSAGQFSHAEGQLSRASGTSAHSSGFYTWARGVSSHSGGLGTNVITGAEKPILADGVAAFNHSTNTTGQTLTHGALSDYSAILGGYNHNIASGNVNAAIIGGVGIKLTGTSYINFTAVQGLAIFSTPPTSVATDNVLAWNPTSKKVKLGTISSTSDIRLKKDFIPFDNVLSKIDALSAYEYTNNDVIKPMEGIKNYGLTAQEVETVFPHVVKDNYEIDGVTYKTVDYRHLVPVLFAAIQELNAKIKNLESKLG